MRMRTAFLGGILVLALLQSGCLTTGGQPKLLQCAIEPDVLRPGGSALVWVNIQDRHGIVERVSAKIREDDRIQIPFSDSGHYPDKQAGDGTWSVTVDVPFTAPPGEYTLVIGAYNSTGELVPVRTQQGTEPLMCSLPFRIVKGESALDIAPQE